MPGVFGTSTRRRRDAWLGLAPLVDAAAVHIEGDKVAAPQLPISAQAPHVALAQGVPAPVDYHPLLHSSSSNKTYRRRVASSSAGASFTALDRDRRRSLTWARLACGASCPEMEGFRSIGRGDERIGSSLCHSPSPLLVVVGVSEFFHQSSSLPWFFKSKISSELLPYLSNAEWERGIALGDIHPSKSYTTQLGGVASRTSKR
ncbi:hypothetical protein DFP72DRAFT_848794 [Ephemerocybe angulata]|uniref:Uncharacterized protein n=1 Tax=Ephemerocybe angulata TaxID=980116 RepID=A0A8H6HXX8_9AGAR|nr:hypothetical protein DFP72DRAFT_848794 [Tulosesus angulatus]